MNIAIIGKSKGLPHYYSRPGFCVIDGKIAREATDKEQEVIDWCFVHSHHYISEIAEIGYATFEREPIKKEWIDKAVPYYLADIKNKYKKWKKKQTLWVNELKDYERNQKEI